MSKQKIISDICPHYKEYGSCEKCREDDVFLDGEPCYYECMANQIIKNNYVKQSEGKWITEIRRICSCCGAEFVENIPCNTYDYCPHCGSRMKGADNEQRESD